MPRTDIIKIETAGAPLRKDKIPQGLHLSFWEPVDQVQLQPGLCAFARRIGELTLIEIKGSCEAPLQFQLQNSEDKFWFTFQFLGQSCQLAHGKPLEASQYTGWYGMEPVIHYRLDPGRVWIVFWGVNLDDGKNLEAEWPALGGREARRIADVSILPHQALGYRQQQAFTAIGKVPDGAYSLPVRLHYHSTVLLDLYDEDLRQYAESQQRDSLSIHRQAIAYISKHYMEEDLGRQQIADALKVSLSTLSRAFANKSVSVSEAVRLARLHKARELIKTTELSMEEIANTLYFTDRKHLAKLYTATFKEIPSAGRARRL